MDSLSGDFCTYEEAIQLAKVYVENVGGKWYPYNDSFLQHKQRQQALLIRRFGKPEEKQVMCDCTLLLIYLRIVYKREWNIVEEGKIPKLYERSMMKRHRKLSPSSRLIRMAVLQAQLDLKGFYYKPEVKSKEVFCETCAC